MHFTDFSNTKNTMKQYDALRDAVYQAGLPILEEDIEQIFIEYETTGELPEELSGYLFNGEI